MSNPGSKPASKAVTKAVKKAPAAAKKPAPTKKAATLTGASRAAVKKTGFTAKKPAASTRRIKQLGDKGFVPLPPRISTTCQHPGAGHDIHWQAVLGRIKHNKSKPCRVTAVEDAGTVVVKVGRQTLTLWFHDPDFIRNCIGPKGDEAYWLGSNLLMGYGGKGHTIACNLGTEPSECTYIERPTYNEEYYGIRREDDPAEDDPDN